MDFECTCDNFLQVYILLSQLQFPKLHHHGKLTRKNTLEKPFHSQQIDSQNAI
jgi:hypothetical protein